MGGANCCKDYMNRTGQVRSSGMTVAIAQLGKDKVLHADQLAWQDSSEKDEFNLDRSHEGSCCVQHIY